jgi:hypothetical protein
MFFPENGRRVFSGPILRENGMQDFFERLTRPRRPTADLLLEA